MYTTRNNPCYVHFEPKTVKNFFGYHSMKQYLQFMTILSIHTVTLYLTVYPSGMERNIITRRRIGRSISNQLPTGSVRSMVFPRLSLTKNQEKEEEGIPIRNGIPTVTESSYGAGWWQGMWMPVSFRQHHLKVLYPCLRTKAIPKICCKKCPKCKKYHRRFLLTCLHRLLPLSLCGCFCCCLNFGFCFNLRFLISLTDGRLNLVIMI